MVVWGKNQTVEHENGGLRYRLPLDNDDRYELSIVSTGASYGGPEGLYEIALIDTIFDIIVSLDGKVKGFEGDDVLGWLTEDDVRSYIKLIKKFVEEELS